jgi:hypothetical protein
LGVEFATELHEIALANIGKYKPWSRCKDVRSVHADATGFRFPDGNLVFFLYNPFGREVLTRFIEKMKLELRGNDRHIYFIYHNAVFIDVIEKDPSFVKLALAGSIYRFQPL